MKIDTNTMTLDEIRDWLAERKGWTRTTITMTDGQPIPIGSEWHKPTNSGSPGSLTWCIHPIPATLDAAAAAMPEGWRIRIYSPPSDAKPWWIEADWHDKENPIRVTYSVNAHGDTEILARFRLAMICILAEEKPNA